MPIIVNNCNCYCKCKRKEELGNIYIYKTEKNYNFAQAREAIQKSSGVKPRQNVKYASEQVKKKVNV